jgi:hypothetical protein
MTWPQVLAWRLRRQFLLRNAEPSTLDVVRRLGGVQAQVASAAEQAVAVRTSRPASGAVAGGLASGSLVKTWAMRGTLHLLPARDLPVYFGALSTYTHYLRQGWVKYFGVTREQIELAINTVSEVLRGRVLSREQLADAVAERTGSKKLGALLRQSWGVLLKPAAYRGQLCFAEGDGARVRFTHPGPVRELDPQKALAELARRYLGAYGPATRDDFARW